MCPFCQSGASIRICRRQHVGTSPELMSSAPVGEEISIQVIGVNNTTMAGEHNATAVKEIQSLLARIASVSDDKEDVSSEEDVLGIIDRVDEWLSVKPDAGDENSVSSILT